MGDNRANLPNANNDYAATSRDVIATNPPFCEWAIIGQTSPNANSDYAATFRDVVPTACRLQSLTYTVSLSETSLDAQV